MIYFGIPLRSKGASKDWNNVTRVFNRTLRSVYRQTNPDFRIFVACHDKPELTDVYDERVEFLYSDTPIPSNRHEMMLDKGWKVSMISKRVKENGGGYTMLVDSDDLVSNRIAEYVNTHLGYSGFLSKYGYVYNDGFTYVKKLRYMHRICGSCSIVNYSVDDLPSKMPENLWDDSLKDTYIIRMSHRKIPDYLASQGRKLETLPFPSTIYVRNTGDNHSMLTGTDLNSKRKLELLLRKKVKLSSGIAEEFGLFI